MKYFVILQEVRLHEVEVEADSPEQARDILLDGGQGGYSEPIGEDEVTIGEIRDENGETVWMR